MSLANILTEEEQEELIDLYIDKCMSYYELADWFGIAKYSVVRYIKKFKLSKSQYLDKKLDLKQELNNKRLPRCLKRDTKRKIKRLEKIFNNGKEQ